MTLFIRKNDVILDTWLSSKGRKPLILRGARQIGKSTAVRRLAERNKKKLVEVDLERHQRLNSTFASLDVDMVIAELEFTSKSKLTPDSILFLDEVQGAPHALAVLRYFFENRPDIPVVAAGSLLEFALEDHQFSMPVGRVEFARMYPVTFAEYLAATGSHLELELITDFISGKLTSISETMHGALLRLYAEYILIGGMPSAVQQTLQIKDSIEKLSAAAIQHSQLIDAFRDDFAKYRNRLTFDFLRKIFDVIPSVVGTTKVKYSSLCPGDRTETVKRALNSLVLAGVVSKVVHTPASGIPISSGEDKDVFKILPLDVGMNSTQSLGILRTSALPQSIFSKWEDGNFIEQHWMGQLAEAAVGQALLAQQESNGRLHYWLREGKSSNAEVDYVIQSETQIVPIEVKSGSSGTLKSLHQFMAERAFKHAIRFDLNPPSIQKLNLQTIVSGGNSVSVSYQLHNLPIYICDYVYDYIKMRF